MGSFELFKGMEQSLAFYELCRRQRKWLSAEMEANYRQRSVSCSPDGLAAACLRGPKAKAPVLTSEGSWTGGSWTEAGGPSKVSSFGLSLLFDSSH